MRQLAWNGVVFDVPEHWELARYHDSASGGVRLVIEDTYAVRMETEWRDAKTAASARRFSSRATRSFKALVKKADRQTVLDGLPPDWRAVHCRFTEVLPVGRQSGRLGVIAHDLVTAIYAPPANFFRCAIRLHFMPGDTEQPEELARRILMSLTWPHPADRTRRWEVFDLAYRLDSAFRLETTTFDIGSKLMVFRRAGRRLYLWTLSCADRLPVHDRDVDTWVIGYLNSTRRVTGIMFKLDPAGGIGWKRRGPFALAHRDELARGCFRYHVDYGVDKTRNHFVIRVFNYRRDDELDWLPAAGTTAAGQSPAPPRSSA